MPKCLASRFNQLKTRDCLTGQYHVWTTRRPDASCWWCQYKIQTREHLFKNCPQWKSQQKILWTTVLEEARMLSGPTRGRGRTKIAELFADERCSQAILDILATTDVGSHRWQKVQEQRSARPRGGTVGNARNGSQL